MNKYKSDDYKLGAVNYYLKHEDSMDKVCKIFDCNKSTLKGWIDRYKTTNQITRKIRKPQSRQTEPEGTPSSDWVFEAASELPWGPSRIQNNSRVAPKQVIASTRNSQT